MRALKLSFQFDAMRLQADVEAAAGGIEWEAHFNRDYYQGVWSGIALRTNCDRRSLYTDPTRLESFADTEALQRCTYVPLVLSSFQCPLHAVRFLRLTPASTILEHRDFGLSYEEGQVRFHIPVSTNPEVEFFLDGTALEMNPGECWYLSLDLPHRAANRGTSDRVR